MVSEVLAPCILVIFQDVLIISHMNFRTILRGMLARLGIYFGSFGGQKGTNMSSKIDAKMGIEKSRFRGRPTAKKSSELVARRGVRGRRFGRKEDWNI